MGRYQTHTSILSLYFGEDSADEPARSDSIEEISDKGAIHSFLYVGENLQVHSRRGDSNNQAYTVYATWGHPSSM